jgi:hypothetical protein
MKNTLIAQSPLTKSQATDFGLVTESETARRLGIDVSTLSRWRETGRGPMTYQVNEFDFMYLETDIAKFEDVCLEGFHEFFGDQCPDLGWKPLQEKTMPDGHLSFSQWLKQQRASAKSVSEIPDVSKNHE